MIFDLKDQSLTNINFKENGKVIKFLSHNFRGRMYKAYFVNSPSSIYYVYNFMASAFLNTDQKKKINILNTNKVNDLYKYCNLEQIPESYGGKQEEENKSYWPPLFKDTQFRGNDENYNDENKLKTEKEYYEIYKEGEYKYQYNWDIINQFITSADNHTNEQNMQKKRMKY